LEAEVRKHIRIEQQLKIHVENVEGQLDSLEMENEKLAYECGKLEQLNQNSEWQNKKQLEIFEVEVASLKKNLEEKE
jgi:predicted RNase H-like nuclease (RuvC/YqgF family)